MYSPFRIFASIAVSGVLLVAANFVPLLTVNQQTAPEATQVAASATMAAAQATIASRLSQDSPTTVGSTSQPGQTGTPVGVVASTPIVTPVPTTEGPRVIFFDDVGNEVPPPVEIKINKVILLENFATNKPFPGWHFKDSRWTVANNGLTLKGFNGEATLDTLAFLPVLLNGNYEAEFSFKWLSGRPSMTSGYFAIDFGETRSYQHPYFMEYGIDEPGMRLRLNIETNNYVDGAGLVEFSRMSPLTDWAQKAVFTKSRLFVVPGNHRIKITKKDSQYAVYLNGNPILNYENKEFKEPEMPVALYIGIKYTHGMESMMKSEPPPVFDDFIIRILD